MHNRYQAKRLYPNAMFRVEKKTAFQTRPVTGLNEESIRLPVRSEPIWNGADYEALYQAWSAYHLPCAVEGQTALHTALQSVQSSALPNHYAMFGFRAMTQRTLQAYLGAQLGGSHTFSLTTGWQKLSQTACLGAAKLANDTILGQRLPMKDKQFIIQSQFSDPHHPTKLHAQFKQLSLLSQCQVQWHITLFAPLPAMALGQGQLSQNMLGQHNQTHKVIVFRDQ